MQSLFIQPIAHTMKIKLYKFIDSVANVVRTFIQDYIRSRISDQSSSMAYLTLFSLVPSLAAIFSLLSLFVPFRDVCDQIERRNSTAAL